MLDRWDRAEYESVRTLGRFAGKMVVALGRVLRGQQLRDTDTAALNRAGQLFELMTRDNVILRDRNDDRMLSDQSYLTALEAVELKANGGTEEYARRTMALLERIQNGTVDVQDTEDSDRAALEGLRDLFEEVDESTLNRAGDLASELARGDQEPPAWQTRHMTSRF